MLPFEAVQADVTVSCRVRGRDATNDAALDVLAGIVRRGLWQSLREDARSYAPSVRLTTLRPDVGLLELSAEVETAQAAGAASAMLDLLRLVAAGVPEPVLAWERLAARGRWSRGWASAAGTWAALDEATAHGIGFDLVRTWPERLAWVDAGAVAALLADCAGHEAVTVVGPDVTDALQADGLAAERVDWQRLGAELARSLE